MSENHDLAVLYIALGTKHRGRVRNQRKNVKYFWRRIQEPFTDTSLSVAQYPKLSVDEKGAKKAQAGFYKFGYYEGEVRKVKNLTKISAVQLDLDNVTLDQIDYIRSGGAQINRWFWIGHTTRSHFPEKPRWRIIIPLARPVDPDKANAIARLAALELTDDPDEAIEIPDQVSFRNNQMAYWPSISRGQEYLVQRNDDGALLDPDEFLAEHIDWQDVSTLPRQEGENSAGISDPNAKIEDPLQKDGIIGAVNRVYPISRMIAIHLAHLYTPGDAGTDEARYTYIPGTGSNGAVVYGNDTIIYSNHSSDPIEGAANAFDLWRIHMKGHLDEKAKEDTPPTKLPSFQAAVEFFQDDPEVAAEIGRNLFDDDDDDSEDDEDAEPVEDSHGSEHVDDDEFDLNLDDLEADDDAEPISRQVRRQEERKKKKKEKAPQDPLGRMNHDHAFVNLGSSGVIADFRGDTVQFRSVPSFLTEYRNREMQDGAKTKTLGAWWLDHPKRRTYPLGVVFRPDGKVPKGMLNLWTGWAVEPDGSQDCSFILNYIWNILANRDQEHYDYILTWLADIVQNPAQKPGVAVVLKGLKGAGKDTLAEIMRRIVGDRHRAKITDSKMIGDKFNAVFEVAMIAHMEEASWGGNMNSKGTLQSYITSPTIRIERKGVDAVELDSFVRFVFTANEDWVVPATADERRYAVFEVSAERKGDDAYWTDFYRRLDTGGAEGFLAYLLAWEKPGYISIRKPPETRALSDQKLAGLRGVDLWWFGLLYERKAPGNLVFSETFEGDEDRDLDDPGWDTHPVTVETNSVREAYDEWRKVHRFKAAERNPAQFGRDLKTLCPSLEKWRPGGRRSRAMAYRIPPLDVCRAEFAAAQNVKLEDCGFQESDDDEPEIDLDDLGLDDL